MLVTNQNEYFWTWINFLKIENIHVPKNDNFIHGIKNSITLRKSNNIYHLNIN